MTALHISRFAPRFAYAAASMIAVAATAPVFAQGTGGGSSQSGTLNDFARRSSGSIAFIQARPVGALARNIGFGYGGNGTYLFRLDREGYLSLRGDLGFAVYGTESERVPLSSTIGGRIQVRVSTDNYVVPFTIGPQLMYPKGSVRPYVNAGYGGQVFYTQSKVHGDDDSFDFATTTNQSDVTHTWVLGGGLLIPVYEGRTRVRIDLGAQYYTGGHAQYLRPGSIEDLPNSQIKINTLESDTHMVLVRLGVNIGM
jgi:hypothetical protein